jgi:hypothetical protein
LWRKFNTYCLLFLKKTLTTYKNPFRNSLQRACCGILKAAYDSKNCSEAAGVHAHCSLEKSSRNRNSGAASEQSFKSIVCVFKKGSKNFSNMFSLARQPKI